MGSVPGIVRLQQRLLRIVSMMCLVCVGSCTNGATGKGPAVPASDLPYPPTVRVDWPFLDVTCPSPVTTSSLWVEVSGIRDATNQVVLAGRLVRRELPKEQRLDLSRMGFSETDVPSLRAIWRNPDGSNQRLQIVNVSE